MSFKIVFGQTSKLDIERACIYYDEQQLNLSFDFLAEIVDAAGTLELNPFFQIRYKDYRILPLKKFPYVIIFWVDETNRTVNIISIFHSSQNPMKYP